MQDGILLLPDVFGPFFCTEQMLSYDHSKPLQQIKEDTTMKTIAINRQNKIEYPAYPNAAERSYFWHRLLDGALAVATAVGAVVVLVFLLML